MASLEKMVWYRLPLVICAYYAVMLTITFHGASGYFSCDFENSAHRLCDFHNDSGNGFNWKLDTANVQKSYTRPMADHSYSNKSGHYVFIESSFTSSGSPASRISRLLSPTIFIRPSTDNSTQEFCLTFYYHMVGPTNQNLGIFVREHGSAIPQNSHWNVSGNLGDEWFGHQMSISTYNGFLVVFQGTKGSTYHGDISMDDISVTEGQCRQDNRTTTVVTTPASVTSSPAIWNEFQCTLENSDVCGFTNDTRNAFDWQWRGDSNQPYRGPLGDHTLRSSSGFYLFVSKVPGTQLTQEQSSRIISPYFARNSAHRCLQFYHSINGLNGGQLKIYVMPEGLTLPLLPSWSSAKSTGNIWKLAYMDIPRQWANYRVVFEVIRGRGFDGTVAIDDIKLINGLCPVLNASCDFEAGIGDFIQDDTDDMNWNLQRFSTWSPQTGPKYDHTLGAGQHGQYLYLETSASHRGQILHPGYVARLLSPVLTDTSIFPRCLTFWYHMFGEHIDTLNVYIINGTSQSTPHEILWTRSGNRGHKWRAAKVHLESAVNFQVVFEATKGVSYKGDIAIDDIQIQADACPGEHHNHNYSSITCDFEEPELCYYEQEHTSDDIDWVWINSDSAAHRLPVGPSTDHTLQNELGFYLYVSFGGAGGPYSSFGTQRRKAWLKSPYASPQTSTSCVEFWYHMYGLNAESLKVFIQKQGEDIPQQHSWQKAGNQGNYWHRATVDVNVINTAFRVVFEATTGSTYRNDIAIDDVTFYNSSCPPFVTEAPPPTTPPPTTTNASCNFDYDDSICGYSQEIEDNSDWSRRSTRRWRNYGSGANRDHTLGTSYTYGQNRGYFMNFDCNSQLRPDYGAQLATPYITPHREPQCMHFFYYMYGTNVDVFNIYVVSYGNTLTNDAQMVLFGNKGNYWRHGVLDLSPSSQPYRVIFEALRGRYSYRCDISLDDITFVNGSCTAAIATTTPAPPPLDSGSCDFEATVDPLCGYEQMSGDNSDWILNNGNTSSIETGPNSDNTYRNAEGHYLYIESSLPNRPRNWASIKSPSIRGSKTGMCLQFNYHMKGTGIGRLRVLRIGAVPQDNRQLVTMTGHQGDNWEITAVDLQPYDNNFKLQFSASVGMIPTGDIAIDDILMIREPCHGHLKESYCSFDVAGDWCGYTQSDEDDFNWLWYNANGNHPPIEAMGDRSYLYAAFPSIQNTANERHITALESHIIDGHKSNEHCVEFDYYLPQTSTSSKITVALKMHDGNKTNILTVVGDHRENGWRHYKMSVQDAGKNFKVVFIGIIGDKSHVIGLDNPTVTRGSCIDTELPNTNSTAPVPSTAGNTTTSLVIFFAVLSTLLSVILLLGVTSYALRKYKKKITKYLPTYVFDGTNVKTTDSSLTIDNPLYGSDPPVISTTGGDNPLYGSEPATVGTSAMAESEVTPDKSSWSATNGGHI